MRYPGLIGAVALVATLLMGLDTVVAGEAKLPDMTGQWSRAHPRSQWDPSKPRGLAQQAPLTPEYLAIFEANLRELRTSGQGVDPQLRCIPSGMPRVMMAYEPMELIVTPEATYVRVDHMNETRHIYTDGRDWPTDLKPTYEGYSIGKWVDEDGDGTYDVLEIETRGPLKGPRYFDADGLPLHQNNRTIVKERIYIDKANRNLLHDEITTIDDALTRPWTVKRDYNREADPLWPEYLCAENNNHIIIGKERYFRGADGFLMPTRKGQAPPDLKNFDPARN
jgi:hypothetical protein